MDDPNWTDEPTFEDQISLTWQERVAQWGWLVVILILLAYIIVVDWRPFNRSSNKQEEGI